MGILCGSKIVSLTWKIIIDVLQGVHHKGLSHPKIRLSLGNALMNQALQNNLIWICNDKGLQMNYLVAFSLVIAAVMMAAATWATALMSCLSDATYRHVMITTKKESQKSRNCAAVKEDNTFFSLFFLLNTSREPSPLQRKGKKRRKRL